MKIDFPIYRTVRVGTGLLTRQDFVNALEKSGFHSSRETHLMMDNTNFLQRIATKPGEVDICIGRVGELTDKESAQHLSVICNAIVMKGYGLCTGEAFLQMLIQMGSKEFRDSIYFLKCAMREISSIGYGKRIFGVTNETLMGEYESTPGGFDYTNRFAFIKPRK